MAKIRIVGDSSGYVEIAAPNAAGNNTLELPSGNTRLVGSDSAGNVSISGIATFTSGIVVSAGTTAAPSISPTGDSNTGIFFPSADTIAFGEGGVESARFDSSGRLGIGTANPSTKIHILGTGNGSTGSTGLSDSSVASALLLKPTSGSGTALALGARNTGGHYIQGLYDASSVDSVRDVQINPYGGSVGIGTFADAFGGAPGSSTFVVATTGLERLRIDSSGRVRMPYQPAFFASGNQGTITVAVGSYFPFNTLNTTFANSNRNNGYSTSTYLYTAPVTGLYQFYIQIYLNPSSNITSMTWWKNGTQLDYGSDAAINIFMSTNSSTTPSNIMMNGSVILELSANDTIGIKPRTGNANGINLYTPHSSFWGYLIG
jgi:hypothetical protein